MTPPSRSVQSFFSSYMARPRLQKYPRTRPHPVLGTRLAPPQLLQHPLPPALPQLLPLTRLPLRKTTVGRRATESPRASSTQKHAKGNQLGNERVEYLVQGQKCDYIDTVAMSSATLNELTTRFVQEARKKDGSDTSQAH